MKIIDRYIAKNFLIGYLITFMVLIGLLIIVDLFLNIDEFAELTDSGLSTIAVLKNICIFYAARSAQYYRDLAGVIVVVAATFSLAKMTYNNELVAVMASGVSLKRILAPIVFLAILLTGILVVDQEIIIPRLATQLVRDHDTLPGEDRYDVWFMSDEKGSLICTQDFEEKTGIMTNPLIIIRKPHGVASWIVVGRIQAEKGVYNNETKRWDLVNGTYMEINRNKDISEIEKAPEPIAFYESNLTPADIPIRRQESFKGLLSSKQLSTLASQRSRIKDLPELYSQKHFRVTDPIINMVMLMVALPILVCRDPKKMKTAIMISFAFTTACFIVSFACKMVATEVFFNQVRPELWAWMPIFIFLPIAFLEIDAMST
jgi:lipopolysaccharide export system permease protein